MKNQFLLCVFLMMFIGPLTIFAQPSNPVPVSPEAAALTKMVDYPINMNTGVPDISIPFYEITAGDLKLPITLQYHAGGFRINEQATRVGLGWSLSSDLQIVRTINGKDDFHGMGGYLNNTLAKAYYPDYMTCPSCRYPSTNQELYYLATGEKDASPDRFTYKLLNKSGSFYFQKDNAGTGYSIVPVPFDNLKIQFVDGMFIITDTDGTVYHFGETGPLNENELAAKGIEVSGAGGGTPGVRSAWKCKRIVSSSGAEEITFRYTDRAESIRGSYNDRVEYYNNEDPCDLVFDGYYTSNQAPMNTITTYQHLISQVPFYRISSPKYRVIFGNTSSHFHVPYLNTMNEPVDKVYTKSGGSPIQTTNVWALSVTEIGFRGGKVLFDGADRLNSIRILDRNNQEVKSLYLYQTYTQASDATRAKIYNGQHFGGTLYLDSLHIRNGSETYERYGMLYENKFCYGSHLRGRDAWGYANASTREVWSAGSAFSIPVTDILEPKFYRSLLGGCTDYASDVVVNIGENSWAEASNKTAMKLGVLNRIVYPTGGYIDFDFEPNQYMAEFVDNDSEISVPQLSGGLRIRAVNTYDSDGSHQGQKYYRYGLLEDGSGTLINKPARTQAYGRFHYGAVSYEQEIAYLKGSDYPLNCHSSNCMSVLAIERKTTYHAASMLDYTYSNGAPVYYQKVTEYHQDLGREVGKTVYEYYPPDTFYDYPAQFNEEYRIPETNIPYIHTEGLIGKQKSVTQYKPDGALGYAKVSKKEYEYQRYMKPEQISVAYAFMRVLFEVVEGDYSGTMYSLYAGTGFAPSPHYPGPLFVYGQYGLPSARLLISKLTQTSYEATDSIQTITDYAYSDLPYLQPSAITKSTSQGFQIEKNLKYAYHFPGTAVYDEMVSLNMIAQPIEELEINTSTGMEVQRKRTNYAIFPEAYGLIMPSSIEHSVQGGPLRTEITFDEYDQYGNLLQSTGINGVPVSCLWGYNNLYPVAVLKGVEYSQIPSSYKSNVQITNPIGDEELQTLLSGLRTANFPYRQVTTYSYKRLVGMSRKVDENGLTIYYEYDPIGRLRLQKDHEQNILANYEYHTTGAAGPWAAQRSYANIPVMRSFSYESTVGEWQFYNRIVSGGSYLSTYSQQGADLPARTAVGDMALPDDIASYPPSSEMACLILGAYIFGAVPIPDFMELDFIRDGSVFATFRMQMPVLEPFYVWYIPPGTYQLSIRVSADINYEKEVLFFSLEDSSYGTREFVQGGTYELQANEMYEVYIQTLSYN